MRNIVKFAGLVAGTALIAACGNSGLLSSFGMNGGSGAGTSAAQQAAIENLALNWCADCPIPEGGATELSAETVTPEPTHSPEPTPSETPHETPTPEPTPTI